MHNLESGLWTGFLVDTLVDDGHLQQKSETAGKRHNVVILRLSIIMVPVTRSPIIIFCISFPDTLIQQAVFKKAKTSCPHVKTYTHIVYAGKLLFHLLN